ncbi:Jag family protein [Dactylosporangium darangshiense]|uniref:R3H domain-containing protein n=1 Tax=Dactylosporangium darangshiense TaxID=579108 RepID=A0ABP8CVE1_9ACTN
MSFVTDTTNDLDAAAVARDEDKDVDQAEHRDATAEADADLADANADDEDDEADEETDEDEEADEDEGDEEAEDDEEADGDSEAKAGSGSGRAATDLFRESEIAADYVEGLLDILDYDGDIDELVVSGRPVVEVVEGGDGSGKRLQALVGQRGATLEALQELSRLAVFRQTGSPSRLLLDVGGYRALRRKELGAIAKNAAEKVKEYGEAVRLEPMSAFERKCVHDVINALPGVESESEGVEPSRRIVVRPTA